MLGRAQFLEIFHVYYPYAELKGLVDLRHCLCRQTVGMFDDVGLENRIDLTALYYDAEFGTRFSELLQIFSAVRRHGLPQIHNDLRLGSNFENRIGVARAQVPPVRREQLIVNLWIGRRLPRGKNRDSFTFIIADAPLGEPIEVYPRSPEINWPNPHDPLTIWEVTSQRTVV